MSDSSGATTMDAEVAGQAEAPLSAATEASSSPPEAAAKDAAPTAPVRRSRAQIQTVRLDPRDIRPSWPTAIATLEQLTGWAVLALRLGTLALIQQCVRELAEENAPADLIVRLRALTDALAHMPLEM